MIPLVVATQIFFIFIPNLGKDEPILTNIVQRGWFNHQLVIRLNYFPFIRPHQAYISEGGYVKGGGPAGIMSPANTLF